MKKKIILVSAVALINDEKKVLIAERPKGKAMAGLWEFPGGKIEPGETPEEALIRELKEELQVSIAQKDLIPQTFSSHSYSDFHLLMPLYLCYKWQGPIVPAEKQNILWVLPQELSEYSMPEADIPLVEHLQQKCKL